MNRIIRLNNVAGLCSLTIEAVASYGDCVMQVIQMFTTHVNRLLITPAKSVRPGRVTKNNPRGDLALFQKDLDALVINGGLKNLYSCVLTTLQFLLLQIPLGDSAQFALVRRN